MKKLIIIAAAILFITGCATQRERTTITRFADYSAYTEEGFFISPNPYVGEFNSIGELEIEITPATVFGEEEDYFSSKKTVKYYEVIHYDELVSIAVTEAKNKGADALVNFSITSTPILKKRFGSYYPEGYRYLIKGFCIKRK